MIRLLRLRRLMQVAVLLLLAALPWLNRDGFTGMKGSLFAFDFFGLPFADPVRLLCSPSPCALGASFVHGSALSGSCPNSYTPSEADVPKNRLSTDFGPGP